MVVREKAFAIGRQAGRYRESAGVIRRKHVGGFGCVMPDRLERTHLYVYSIEATGQIREDSANSSNFECCTYLESVRRLNGATYARPLLIVTFYQHVVSCRSWKGTGMCDQEYFDNDRKEYERLGKVTRKQFGLLLGAGVAMALPQVANAVTVSESDVNVTTPEGIADCFFAHPSTGTAPGVLMWPDIFGLRPAFKQMGRRLAQSGYSVLVVNPFYRAKKAPTADAGAATPIDQVRPLAQSLNESTNLTDAKAFLTWLDGQPSVAKDRKMGTQGYCMGGPMAFRTAAAVPERVGAVATFHGGGLVTDKPTSPHLQAAQSKAQFLIAIAANDDARSPNDKEILKETFAKAHLPAEIEVYTDSAHGWCPPDSHVYNEQQAEKAWRRLLVLYGRALA